MSIPPTPNNQEESKYRQTRKREWIKLGIELVGISVLAYYAGFIMGGWQHDGRSIMPLVYILVAYLMGLFTSWRQKDKNREQVDSIQERTERRATIKFWVEIAGVTLLAIYAGFTIAAWYVSNQQLVAMKGRAWVEIETKDITLKDFPGFDLVGTPQDKLPETPLPGEPEYPYPSINMKTSTSPITVRNFGNVPARQSVINASFLILGERPGNDFWGRQWIDYDWDKYACDEAFFVKRYSPGMETPIFPGESEHSIYARRQLPTDVSKVSQYAIVVCVAYEDSTTGNFHHTSVAYCPDIDDRKHLAHAINKEMGIDGNKRPYSADLWYSPAKQFHRCRADAD